MVFKKVIWTKKDFPFFWPIFTIQNLKKTMFFFRFLLSGCFSFYPITLKISANVDIDQTFVNTLDEKKIKIVMSTDFQMIMLMLGTDYIGRKNQRQQPSHPVLYDPKSIHINIQYFCLVQSTSKQFSTDSSFKIVEKIISSLRKIRL